MSNIPEYARRARHGPASGAEGRGGGGEETRVNAVDLVGKRMFLVSDQENLKSGASLLYTCSRTNRGSE